MRSTRRRPAWLAGVLALACVAASGAHAGRAEDDGIRRLARAAGQGEPLMRIGLESGHRVLVSAPGEFRIVDPASGEAVWKPSYRGEVAAVAEGGPPEGVPSVFRVQTGAFSDREAAEREARRLGERFAVPAVVRHHPDRGSWRVRVGASAAREGLGELVERLRAAGLEGTWIVEEPAEVTGDVRIRLVDASFDSRATGRRRLVVVPEGRGEVEVEGRRYRGVVELRVDAFGAVRAINWIELERYLLGVVPAELGPEVWPQLEALKAQAVAARTYAWKNRGQFDDEGFDLCATPRCQVYGGASAEHPVSDRAVAETRGEVVTWQGEPISALYTATCGGHTEDGAEVFPEERAPYLKGVPCRAEAEVLARLTVALAGAELAPVTAEDGRDVTRDLALLASAGVVRETSAAELLRPVSAEALRRWTRELARLSGRPEPRGRAGEVDDLGRAAATLVADLAWTERARVLLDDGDLAALLRDPEAEALPVEQRRALAVLAFSEGLRPHSDGSFHVGDPPSAARLVPSLARIGEAYDAFELREGSVAGGNGGELRLARGKSEVTLPVARRPFLFKLGGGRAVPARTLELWPGDRVRYRRGRDGRVDFLELMPPVKGTADDRVSARYSWEVRKTRRELEAAVNRRVAVGRLLDLQVVRRGVSGRAVELKVVGSRGETVVRGFDVRNLLDLQEILTVIEVQRDPQGRLEAVVFAGKGWGHGVGLCQVGAYGMALRGSDYRAILGHYYGGTRIEALAGAPGPGS